MRILPRDGTCYQDLRRGWIRKREANLREGALREHTARRITVSVLPEMTSARPGSACWADGWMEDSHQETGLTAGTIAHDNELAADLSHLETEKLKLSADKGCADG